jgi:hypothetical protein
VRYEAGAVACFRAAPQGSSPQAAEPRSSFSLEEQAGGGAGDYAQEQARRVSGEHYAIAVGEALKGLVCHLYGEALGKGKVGSAWRGCLEALGSPECVGKGDVRDVL